MFAAVISQGNYHFESNSQRQDWLISSRQSCDFPRKLPFWKQFTTVCRCWCPGVLLWFPKETTILKAIHNNPSREVATGGAVISQGNYHFESNSQLNVTIGRAITRCDFPRKLPFWKQFTTVDLRDPSGFELWFPKETTIFESNSQHLCGMYWSSCSCDFPRKLPFWKQFTTWAMNACSCVSCDFPRKLPFWKQFTTWSRSLQKFFQLWFPKETTILKAIHNLWHGIGTFYPLWFP